MKEGKSKYYNDTPEEAFKKFHADYTIRAVITMVIAVVLLMGTFFLYWNWDRQIVSASSASYDYIVPRTVVGLLYMVTLVLIFILGLKLGLTFCMRPTIQLLSILVVDCDPVKMYDIYVIWEQSDKKGKRKDAFLLQKAQCCRYIPERREEGRAYLEQVDFKKKQLATEANRLLNVAAYAKYKNDRIGFDRAKADMEQLVNQYPGNKLQRRSYEKVMQSLVLQELLWDEKDTEARTILQSFLETEDSPLNKVMFHMDLARLDVKEQEYENARTHLEYVITHGNRLPVVAEAKELSEICNRETGN